MSFIELAEQRYSVRKYLQKDVEQEKIDTILQAAQLAPSAANFQPVRFYILESEEAKENLSKITKYIFNAPVWILVAYDSEISWKNKYTKRDGGDVDCAIAITHMMLAAEDIGLGTCWIGSFDVDLAKELYKLPNNIVPVALLPIGYPDRMVPCNPLHYKRIPIENHTTKI